MAMNITQFNEKWRIEISEIWQFDSRKDFEDCLKKLIDFKEKHGQLSKEERRR